MNEQALRLRVGGPEVMRAQYEHLTTLAERPNITLQVVLPERGPHAAVTGQFVVLDFAGARPVAYAEVQDGAMYVQHPGEGILTVSPRGGSGHLTVDPTAWTTFVSRVKRQGF